jgi:hypothetical protein
MIDKSFLEKVEQMSAPIMFPVGGVNYSSKPISIITPPQAAKLAVNSLSAVIDFCGKEMEAGQHVLHIVDHAKVSLLGPLSAEFRTREHFVVASAFGYAFTFGTWYPVDEFIISLQAQFIQDETTASILKLVGNMTKVQEIGTKDDGVTQRVEAKTGLAKVENISVPNPVKLAPFRTFIEIDQPYSNFVLRLDANHRCALFEADGGAWKIEAMQKVKVFLQNGLKSIGKAEQITILC